MRLYELSESIKRLETLVDFCKKKGGSYYLSHVKRFERRLTRLKVCRTRLIDAEIKHEMNLRYKV